MSLTPFSVKSLLVRAAACMTFATLVAAQARNSTSSVVGTWSSGSMHVMTGLSFANPINSSFDYPKVPGYSFSFTEDGYFEQAQFTWASNATRPDCIQATVLWQHGTYTMNPNGTISTSSEMFAGDGRIQVQNACSKPISAIYYYNQPGYYKTWAISQWRDKTMLRLGSYDGSLLPRMYKISNTPSDYMWPTTYLTNTTTDSTSTAS